MNVLNAASLRFDAPIPRFVEDEEFSTTSPELWDGRDWLNEELPMAGLTENI